jgi:glycerophosphoryl diester phosphodiesterase
LYTCIGSGWYQQRITLPDMQKPSHRPWVIAHRGASHTLRENTVAAFREAYALGADAAEMDVRVTADGALVVHHDAVIAEVGPIIEMDRDDLEEAAPWVPDLTDALAACAGMWVNLEIKNSSADPDWDESQRVARLTAAALGQSASIDRCLVSSFNPETIRVVAEALPPIKTGWLVDVGIDPIGSIALAAAGGHTSIHPYVDALAGDRAFEVVGTAHEAGLLVIVWTTDDIDEMVRLAGAGVDGIITNVPDAARSAFEHHDRDGS